jgi:hypothetical protein
MPKTYNELITIETANFTIDTLVHVSMLIGIIFPADNIVSFCILCIIMTIFFRIDKK